MPAWKKVIVSGSDASLNSLDVTTSFTASGNIYPTGLGADRQVLKTDGLGNITFGYPEEIVAIVKNVSGVTLQKGTPVHATASGAMGNVVGVVAALASDASLMPATFVLNETLIDEAEGEALAVGFIQGVDTSAFEVGQIVYVGPNGGYVGVKPTGSNLIQNLGIVTKVDAVNGSGYVLGAGRSNDVPNIQPGYMWVGNTSSVATPTPTSSLSVLSAVSASYVSGTIVAPGSDTQIAYNNNGILFATSSLVYSGSRIGLNTSTPVYGLDIVGTGANGSARLGNGLYSRYLFNPTATATWIEFTPSVHQIQFTTNGVERMRINPTGLVGIGTITPSASLDVAGTTRLSGSFNTSISGSILTVIGSGSAQPLFTVQGSQGELFSITDSLSGSLFSVNDISGLPILEVFSDNTTLMGSYLDPMLITTTKITQTNSGSFTVYSLPTASYDTAFFEYSIKSGSNARAGTIMAIQDGSTVNFTETTTTDIGDTTAVSFTVLVTGSNIALTGSSTSGAWVTKCIIRGI